LKNLQLNASAREWLFVPKPVPKMTGLGERGQEWVLGSVAQVVGRETAGEIPLPEWGSEIPEVGVRDISEPAREVVETTTAPVIGPRVGQEVREKKKEKKIIRDLDKFYASESETEEEDEEEEEDDEDEEESGEEEAHDQRSESEEETDEESEEDNTERLPLNREWS
jgi:AP-3 complex subunit beta